MSIITKVSFRRTRERGQTNFRTHSLFGICLVLKDRRMCTSAVYIMLVVTSMIYVNMVVQLTQASCMVATKARMLFNMATFLHEPST